MLSEIYENFPFDERCARCPRAFSSIWEANWTFVQTIVVRDAWATYCLPIIEEHWWSAVIFTGVMITITFGVLTLIPAVVIDTFAERRRNDIPTIASTMEFKEAREKAALQKIFDRIDEDGSGEVNYDEIRAGAAVVPEFRQYLRVLDIDENDLQDLFNMIDSDGSGDVSH